MFRGTKNAKRSLTFSVDVTEGRAFPMWMLSSSVGEGFLEVANDFVAVAGAPQRLGHHADLAVPSSGPGGFLVGDSLTKRGQLVILFLGEP